MTLDDMRKLHEFTNYGRVRVNVYLVRDSENDKCELEVRKDNKSIFIKFPVDNAEIRETEK